MAAVHTYRYPGPSRWTTDAGLQLATDGGRQANPHVFRGVVERADVVARGLLAVAEVARTRYFDPGASVRSRDPIVTASPTTLRFESLSSCNGVYARLDVTAFDADRVDGGTTNVDVNEPLRAALAGVAPGDPMRVAVGTDHLQVDTLDGSVVEREVPLPDRWLKGLAEVQLASAAAEPVAVLGTASARRALRDLPAQRTGNRVLWAVPASTGLRLQHRPGAASASVVGPQRLAAVGRVLPFVRGLAVHAGRHDGDAPAASAWVVDLDGARLTLVLSPELYRGFSGEGAMLDTLARVPAATEAVAPHLHGQPRLDPDRLAAEVGAGPDEVAAALRVLGAMGRVGHDLAEQAFFHRDLPFDRTSLEELHPRLQKARALLAGGAVVRRGDQATVDSDATTYTVRRGDEADTCTCAWFARYRGTRGPCAHVLAVVLADRQEAR